MTHRIIPSREIAYRTDFALLCNARGYRDAVEVGTDLGVFALDFLNRFRGNWLFSVDPYQPVSEHDFDRMGDLMTAAIALGKHHGRHRFVRMPSPAAAPIVASMIRPDFVYVDGSHEEADCHADLVAWWEVLAKDGMLAGHDFDADHPGVMRAVTRFAADRDLIVRLTHETTSPPSFYVYKTEPVELIQKLFLDGSFLNDEG